MCGSKIKVLWEINKVFYLLCNSITPVEAGFVEQAEDWLYSSARQYYTGQKGLLDIIQIEPMLNTV